MSRTTRLAVAVFLASALSATLCAVALAAPGDLDSTFSADGKVTTNFTRGADFADDVALQADGKIVAAGRASGRGGFGTFALVRYNPDGTLDTTFSGDGKRTTNFTRGEDSAFGVAIQADGKIVSVGEAGGAGGRFALARYNTDGTLDTSFGGDGKVTTNFTRREDLAIGVAIRADGRIVAAGTANFFRFALARYNTNGTLDTTFGGDGKVTTNFRNGVDVAAGVGLQADGKIVAGGSASGFGRFSRFAMARYNTNGSLDASFSGDGKVTTDFARGDDIADAVAIQPDGRIVAAGTANFLRFALARYNANGTLDTTFGGDGKLTTNFTRGGDVARDVALQADGKIVAAGDAGFFGGFRARFALARYNPTGARDTTFSGDGKVTTSFSKGFDSAAGVAIQADGNIVAAGRAGGSGGRFALTRFLGN